MLKQALDAYRRFSCFKFSASIDLYILFLVLAAESERSDLRTELDEFLRPLIELLSDLALLGELLFYFLLGAKLAWMAIIMVSGDRSTYDLLVVSMNPYC